MRQSIGMSQQLNLIIIFILIVFGLIAASLSYYKAFKINNVITDSIEKYEGYNDFSKNEIKNSLASLGYQKISINCNNNNLSDKSDGFCAYLGDIKKNGDNVVSYNYKVTTYMYIDLPIINIIKIPITATTNQISCVGNNNKCKEL